MYLQQFDYTLPPDRIAQEPVVPRDHSRLMVLDRQKLTVSDRHFYDLPSFLQAGDVLVLNNTKVIPVRLHGHKTTGGQVEILLTKKTKDSLSNPSREFWEALTKPGLKVGQVVQITDQTDPNKQLILTCQQDLGYTRQLEVESRGFPDILTALHHLGETPTPPYIKQFEGDPQKYQTVFARHEGSAAAPTAGLHFTPTLLAQLQAKGVVIAPVTLHVGLGTFLHVTTEQIENHHMHREWFEIPPDTAQVITTAKQAGQRVIAVGTTSLRTLEAAAKEQKDYSKSRVLQPQRGETDLFIYPSYQFRLVDALITNYHLPKSTLLMLVSAFTCAPQSQALFEKKH